MLKEPKEGSDNAVRWREKNERVFKAENAWEYVSINCCFREECFPESHFTERL